MSRMWKDKFPIKRKKKKKKKKSQTGSQIPPFHSVMFLFDCLLF